MSCFEYRGSLAGNVWLVGCWFFVCFAFSLFPLIPTLNADLGLQGRWLPCDQERIRMRSKASMSRVKEWKDINSMGHTWILSKMTHVPVGT